MNNPTPVFFATVKDGKVLFSNKNLWELWLSKLDGQDVDVIVRKHKKDRTQRQNRYYWNTVVAIPAKHFGYTPEEIHESFKWLFLRKNEEGKPLTVRSTIELSTIEFMEYVEQCKQWCADQSLFIPDPESVT